MTDCPSTSPDTVNTRKVAGRRLLHFESLDQMMADVKRLAVADQAGRLRRLGNWTLGQALGHLAAWAGYGYTAAPLRTPFLIRLILRLRKRKFLRGPMSAGVKIPRVPGGTLATEPLSLAEGLSRLERVMERLKVEAPTFPSPALGQLTHEEAMALSLRHAELHLSFFVPA